MIFSQGLAPTLSRHQSSVAYQRKALGNAKIMMDKFNLLGAKFETNVTIV